MPSYTPGWGLCVHLQSPVKGWRKGHTSEALVDKSPTVLVLESEHRLFPKRGFKLLLGGVDQRLRGLLASWDQLLWSREIYQRLERSNPALPSPGCLTLTLLVN